MKFPRQLSARDEVNLMYIAFACALLWFVFGGYLVSEPEVLESLGRAGYPNARITSRDYHPVFKCGRGYVAHFQVQAEDASLADLRQRFGGAHKLKTLDVCVSWPWQSIYIVVD
jgi:hypothetical protein